MIWGRRCPIHGRRAKLLDRAAAAAHVDCCVLCVCLWLCLVCGSDSSLRLDLDSCLTQLQYIVLLDAGPHLLLQTILGVGEV